jgi:hypothetical protein
MANVILVALALVCPLMIVAMMLFMRGHRRGGPDQDGRGEAN